MRIAICEDSASQRQGLTGSLLAAFGGARHQLHRYHSADMLLFHYDCSHRPYDLIFMDMEAPGDMSGLEASQRIRAGGDDVPIVLVSACEEHALAGCNLRPEAYLLKPVGEAQLLEIVQAVEKRLLIRWNSSLVLPVPGGFSRIAYDHIYYAESSAHKVLIHTVGESLPYPAKLSDIKAKCDRRFLQCHKSYLVNADWIRGIEERYTKVLLGPGYRVPISRQRKAAFLDALQDYRHLCAMLPAQ